MLLYVLLTGIAASQNEAENEDQVLISGTLVLVDEEGREDFEPDGRLCIWVWNDEETYVSIQSGQWSAQVRRNATISISEARIGDEGCFIEFEPRIVTEDMEFELRAVQPRVVELRVYDALDGTELREVTVIEDVWVPPRLCHPGTSHGALAENEPSPIRLQLDDFHLSWPFVHADYFVGAPGYAWEKIAIDHRQNAGARCALVRGGDLAIRMENLFEDHRFLMKVYRLESEGLVPYWHCHQPRNSSSKIPAIVELKGLEPGRYAVLIVPPEQQESFELREDVTIEAGEVSIVQLALPGGEAPSERGKASVRIGTPLNCTRPNVHIISKDRPLIDRAPRDGGNSKIALQPVQGSPGEFKANLTLPVGRYGLRTSSFQDTTSRLDLRLGNACLCQEERDFVIQQGTTSNIGLTERERLLSARLVIDAERGQFLRAPLRAWLRYGSYHHEFLAGLFVMSACSSPKRVCIYAQGYAPHWLDVDFDLIDGASPPVLEFERAATLAVGLRDRERFWIPELPDRKDGRVLPEDFLHLESLDPSARTFSWPQFEWDRARLLVGSNRDGVHVLHVCPPEGYRPVSPLLVDLKVGETRTVDVPIEPSWVNR